MKNGEKNIYSVTSQNTRLTRICTFSEGSAHYAMKKDGFLPSFWNSKLRLSPTMCKYFPRSPHISPHMPPNL